MTLPRFSLTIVIQYLCKAVFNCLGPVAQSALALTPALRNLTLKLPLTPRYLNRALMYADDLLIVSESEEGLKMTV
jgi:hypothetical protein